MADRFFGRNRPTSESADGVWERNSIRVLAVHDSAGHIISLVASPEDAPTVSIELRAGEYMHAVDVSELSLDMEESRIYERLAEVAENFRVDAPEAAIPKAQLIPRDS
ncbi:hypothetical protein [Streptomyces sp. NPDC054838]